MKLSFFAWKRLSVFPLFFSLSLSFLLAGKLSADDLNALIAHAHRRIDQLNRELAEQRVREQIHIDAALEQQKMENQHTQENAINTALQHITEDARLERERKVESGQEAPRFESAVQYNVEQQYLIIIKFVYMCSCLS